MGMTEQEAIKKHIEECRDRIDVIQAYMKANNEDANVKRCERNIFILEIAIKVLEKQIAKKPIIEPWNPAQCPSCGCELSESMGDGYYKHYYRLKRCLNDDCGQKLDWGDEDAE